MSAADDHTPMAFAPKAAAPRPASAIRLVAEREISERARGRTTRVTTIVAAALVVAGIIVPGLIKEGSGPTRIGLLGATAQSLAPALQRTAAATKVRILLSEPESEANARRQLRKGKLDLALSVGSSGKAQVEVKQMLSAESRALLVSALDETHLRELLRQAGISPAKVLLELSPSRLQTHALQPQAPDRTARSIAAFAAGLLMYLALAFYGTAVANGVAQEKTSRAAEVLLAAIRPTQLLVGKVLGIGLMGLAQLSVAAGAGLIANALVHSAKIPGSVWTLLPAFLPFFLAGFSLYAFALAAAAALVSRQEEVQSVTTPIMMPLIGGYLLVFAAIGSPDATWLRIVSFLPPWSASLMPVRIALGHIAWWEILLDALIMLISIYGLARLAARIYAGALLHGGERLSWRAALRQRSAHTPAGATEQ
jgi:ABC-2 type transport system permease protein